METVRLKLVTNTREADKEAAASPVRTRIGEILRAHGLVSASEVDAALDRQTGWDAPLGELLCAEGTISRKSLSKALEAQWETRHIDFDEQPADGRLLREMGVLTCLADRTLPWRRVGAATVLVTETPDAFAELKPRYEARLGPVMMALAEPGAVAHAIAASHRYMLLHRAEARVAPHLSCRLWQVEPFCLGAITLAVAAMLLGATALSWLVAALLLVATASLAAVMCLKLSAAIVSSLPERASAEVVELHEARRHGRLPVISVLVPLYKEEHIAAHLIHRLERLDYPRVLLDICLVMEEDDKVTAAALSVTDLPGWMRVVTVPEGSLKTKPRAMNYALDFCRGNIIGIYDAEDAPDPGQLCRVAARFAEAGPRVACLQGALDFYNTRHNWMSRCFTLEYAGWFRVILPGIARLGLPVPLGGTTLFIRRKVLEDLGGWDAHNVTEDADLGIRIARAGYRTELLATVTEEEANSRPVPWIKQRSRWLKGYAMTYAVHMRNPKALWHDLGPRGFFGLQAIFLGTLIQFALAPVLWSMWLLPLGLPHPAAAVLPAPVLTGCAALYVLSEVVNFGISTIAMRRTGRRWLLPWALAMPLYFTLATAGVYKAIFEMFHNPFYWDKTQHGAFGGARRTHSLWRRAVPADACRIAG